MRQAPPSNEDRDMGMQWTHLLLDIDLRTEPISGEIGAYGAEPHRFTGYSGLIAALESIRNGEPPPPAPEAASATHDA
jgi:hypothetical protein